MFQNEYIGAAVMLPAVNAAFRAYELTLRSIMSSNDGYIPPGLIEYHGARLGSSWDQWSLDALNQMIQMGSVADIARDPFTGFHILDKDGHSIKLASEVEAGEEKTKPLQFSEVSDDEKLMYMTLAKGLGMVSARFLEMFAQSKCPGSTQPDMALTEQFHSIPYEGIAKSLNYFSQYIHKWRMGSYKFFYLFNQLIPDGKKHNQLRIDPNDSTEAIKSVYGISG